MRQVISCFLLLVVLAGCQSTERTADTSTSEESSSKMLSPIVEDEVVREQIFVDPEEVPLLSDPVTQSQELEQAFAENQKVFVPGPPPGLKKRISPPAPKFPASVESIQPKTLQDVYFAFDEVNILPSAKLVLEANAVLLRKLYKNRKLLVEGHCDERGSVEYNLVLGLRRAEAVKAYLIDSGIQQSRMGIVSYGKERPVCFQAHEKCWQSNRRTHFVLQ